MNELLRLTQLLYSCWIISDPQDGGTRTIPTSGGILEYALREAVKNGAFPEWAKKQLHFVDGNAGLVCVELTQIESLATSLSFTKDPNPSYTRTTIVVGKPLARRCLAKLGISEEEATNWGNILRKSAVQAESQFQLA